MCTCASRFQGAAQADPLPASVPHCFSDLPPAALTALRQVYIVATAHISEQSQQDVRDTIEQVSKQGSHWLGCFQPGAGTNNEVEASICGCCGSLSRGK